MADGFFLKVTNTDPKGKNLLQKGRDIASALGATVHSHHCIFSVNRHALFTNCFKVNSVTANTCGAVCLFADKQQIDQQFCVGLVEVSVLVVISVVQFTILILSESPDRYSEKFMVFFLFCNRSV